MGYDLSGQSPTSNKGSYFRNNVWWWRSLWNFTCQACQDFLTVKDMKAGGSNDNMLITKPKAKKMANRLNELLRNGDVVRWKEKYYNEMKKLPLEKCKHCKGTGTRRDGEKPMRCNACSGYGKTKHWGTHYPFSVSNVKEFAEFVEHSGGFRIG